MSFSVVYGINTILLHTRIDEDFVLQWGLVYIGRLPRYAARKQPYIDD